MTIENRMSILDDECLMIRHSGEIPEVALHNALHFLTGDPEGPGLKLRPNEVRRLNEAVIGRYRRIILRDLDPRLRDKRVYRGIARSISNWERLCRFATREGVAIRDLKNEIAAALKAFLKQEIADVVAGRRTTSINCDADRLTAFGAAVGFDFRCLPSEWQRHLGRI